MGGKRQCEKRRVQHTQSQLALQQQCCGLALSPDGMTGAAWVAAATGCLHVPQVGVGSWRSRFPAFLTGVLQWRW